MADTVVKNLITKLVLDDKGYKLGMKDASGQMVNMARIGKTLSIGVAAVGAAMTAAAGAAALLTKQTVAIGDKYDKLSQRIGISVEKLSAYNHLAELSGTSLEGMATSVGRLSRNILDASEGVGEAKDAFERLGIEATDTEGNLKDADVVMMDIAERFKEMPDGAEKTALAMETMGRSGTAMIPMLNQGAEGMARMLDEGKQLRAWTTAQAKEAALLNDNFTRLKNLINGIKDDIGRALIPAFQAAIQTTYELFVENRNLIEGGIGDLSDGLKYNLIPAFSTFLKMMNMGTTLAKTQSLTNLVLYESIMTLKTGITNMIAETLAKFLGWVPGIGKILREFRDNTNKTFDELSDSVSKHMRDLIDIPGQYAENNRKIDELQEDLIMNFDASYKRMIADQLKFDDDYMNNRHIRHLQEIEAQESLNDRIAELTEDKYDYMRIKLEREYEAKAKLVNDKKLLDEWYDLEWRKIQDAEDVDSQARMDEKIARIEQYTNRYIEVLMKSSDLEKELVKTTGQFVVESINKYTQEKVRTAIEAAIKIVTGHIAEGLALVGATGVTVWDAIMNIGIYAGKIGGSILLARSIARKIKLEEGGWLTSHPRGGTINEGSTGRADDVLLASAGNTDFYGSRGESVFVMNAEASKKWAPILAGMNISTGFSGRNSIGFAEGGLLEEMSKALSNLIGNPSPANRNMTHDEKVENTAKNLTMGLIRSMVGGWALAGDWLHGIPKGADDAIKFGVAGIPAMFLGKALGKSKIKSILGFGLGGMIKSIFKNPLKAPSILFSNIKEFLTDPVMYAASSLVELTGLLGKLTRDMIMKWMIEIASSIGPIKGIANNLVSFEGKKTGIGGIVDAIGAMLNPINFIKGMLPNLDNGGMITGGGLVPLGTGGIPFAGVGQAGEVIVPPGKMGSSLNITLMGIDRRNARRIVRDVIIPEINFYRSSKGLSRL